MINLFRNRDRCEMKKHQGAATLIITVILLLLSTLIMFFAANYGILQEKSIANVNRHYQAFEAADAGLEFGINYLQKNWATILAGPVSGFITPYSDASTTNITLTNGSKFSVVYTNPTANNYNIIKITSTGVSSDGTSTYVVSQLVRDGSILFSPATVPLVTQGDLNVAGNSEIKNTFNSSTIMSGGAVAFSGSSQTTLTSGKSSSSSSIKSDVQANNTALSNLSLTDFFATYFGSTSTQIQNKMAHTYSNSGSTNYSSTLNGMTGTTIWIDQTGGTATINGSTTIGSAANPVLLIVNGNLALSGNLTIYGYIFTFGTNTIDSITGNVNITGALVTAGELNITGSTVLSYNPSVITNLQNLPATKYYAKVPGSWRDF